MSLPSAIFGLLCALLIGALFHMVVDGGPAKLLLYFVLSTAGFAAGQWISSSRGWTLLPVGPLDLGAAALASLVFLGIGHWLSLVRVTASGSGDKV